MRYLLELAERTAATYAMTYLGLLLAAGFDLTDVSQLRAAGIAAAPAALTVVYGALARFVGDPTPALLPAQRKGQ